LYQAGQGCRITDVEHAMRDHEAIRHLEQSSQYRVIRRLHLPDAYHAGSPATARLGIVIDVEATGLDTRQDRVIELGFVAFEYDAASGKIYRVLHQYDGFEDPGTPLTDIVRRITGITDEMLQDQKLDDEEISAWLAKADLVIAHNAAFDRQMLERRLPLVCQLNWACTQNDIPWEDEDIASLKLDYIAYRLGFFFDGHRAVNDAQATLHLLTCTLPCSGRPAMTELLCRARQTRCRFFATGAPFDKKDVLRERGYRWLPDCTYQDGFGKPKKGVWSRAVPEEEADAERQWLAAAVYGGKHDAPVCRKIHASERYSVREFDISP